MDPQRIGLRETGFAGGHVVYVADYSKMWPGRSDEDRLLYSSADTNFIILRMTAVVRRK